MALEAHIIHQNYFRILEQIHHAAVRSGRDPSQIRLVVVTKGQPVEAVRAVVEAGARFLGENYPEEALPKMEALRDYSLEWHMIGHLQSRKVRLIAQYFDWFEALDSLPLAQKLERALAERGRRLPVLLEFNVGGEESKSGWRAENPATWSAFLPEIEQILTTCPHLDVRGIMTMPPLSEVADQARQYFAYSRRLRDYLAQVFPNTSWDEISMGTSVDYLVAIEEGATMVRIGQAILGPRL